MLIAYIGPKKTKIDKISGSRMVFPQFEAMEVEKEFAHQLLRFPTVYVEEKNLKAAMEKQKEATVSAAALIEEKKQAGIKELKDASRVINLDGQEVDLNKYTLIKLETLVESQDLDIATKAAGEKVYDYCERVFTAFVAKNESDA